MNIALIFAGGVGKRMNSRGIPKQFIKVYNKEILVYTLEQFQDHNEIDAIVVVMLKNYIDYTKKLVEQYRLDKVKIIVEGGNTGQLSIYNGLVAANSIKTGNDIVLVHDGVRPLINSKVISDNIESVRKYGSAVTVATVNETIVSVDDEANIDQVYRRDHLKIARAPQCFYLNDLYANATKAFEDNLEFIDSCSLMNHYGKKIKYVIGPIENIKITTVDDYYTFRAIIQAKENAQIYEDNII